MALALVEEEAEGVAVLAPTGPVRARFMSLLYRIKAGDVGASARAGMRAIAHARLDEAPN